MAKVLGTVHLPKMADILAEHLRDQIISGELQEGDPLPPEDQLMEHASVARTTVREALRILESEGLLTVRRGAGGGARIKRPSVSNVARYIGLVLQAEGATLRDVYDARMMLEAPAARMLAERDDRADVVESLRACLQDEEAALGDPVRMSHAYGKFHQVIVQLSGSRTLETLTAVSNRLVQVHADRYMSAPDAGTDREWASIAAHRAHGRLVELIGAGAAQDAEELWRKHLAAGDTELLSRSDETTVLDLVQ